LRIAGRFGSQSGFHVTVSVAQTYEKVTKKTRLSECTLWRRRILPDPVYVRVCDSEDLESTFQNPAFGFWILSDMQAK
jgi:hypothetical protein